MNGVLSGVSLWIDLHWHSLDSDVGADGCRQDTNAGHGCLSAVGAAAVPVVARPTFRFGATACCVTLPGGAVVSLGDPSLSRPPSLLPAPFPTCGLPAMPP
jgi:hypothetical protein